MPTYSLTLEYDGTDFAGWQIQPRVRTAMGVLQDAIRTVTASRLRSPQRVAPMRALTHTARWPASSWNARGPPARCVTR